MRLFEGEGAEDEEEVEEAVQTVTMNCTAASSVSEEDQSAITLFGGRSTVGKTGA